MEIKQPAFSAAPSSRTLDATDGKSSGRAFRVSTKTRTAKTMAAMTAIEKGGTGREDPSG